MGRRTGRTGEDRFLRILEQRVCLHRCTSGCRVVVSAARPASEDPARPAPLGLGHVWAAQSSPQPPEHGLPRLPPEAQLRAQRDTSPSFSETQASVPRPLLPCEGPRPPKDPLKSPAGGCSPRCPRA